jgi:hypothetical protein
VESSPELQLINKLIKRKAGIIFFIIKYIKIKA